MYSYLYHLLKYLLTEHDGNPTPGRLRQEYSKFKASVFYIVSPYLSNSKKDKVPFYVKYIFLLGSLRLGVNMVFAHDYICSSY
jgi:hypothetical protein